MEEQLQTVRGVSPEEVHRFETLFKLFDEDGSGCISISELADLMPRLGIFLSEDELQVLFYAVDSDGSGDIDFNEFLALMVRQREANQLALLESGERLSFSMLEEGTSLPRGKMWPDCTQAVMWESLVLVAVLFFLVTVLLEDVHPTHHLSVGYRVFPALVLLGDLVLRATCLACVSGTNDDIITTSAQGIFFQYVKNPLCVADLLSAIPVDLAALCVGSRSFARLAAHLRLLKLFRVPAFFPIKSRELMSPLYAQLHFGIVPMIRMIFWAFASIHSLSCLWIWVSKQEVDDADVSYLDACYFVVYTLTTVGYGDISVGTTSQKGFALFLFMCSTCVTGLVVGKLVQWSQQADLKENTYRSMLETLAVLQHLRVPEDFKQEILALQYHRLLTSFSLYESTIAGMPLAMRDRMMLYARMTIVRHVPIFAEQSDICLAKLAMALVNVMVPPEEYVIIAGEEGSEMFFLFHGMCDVYLANGQRVAVIRRGGIFGEIALLQATRRAASIRSLTYCQLFRLDKVAFDDITLAFSSLREAIESEMNRRAAKAKPKPEKPSSVESTSSARGSLTPKSEIRVAGNQANDDEPHSDGPDSPHRLRVHHMVRSPHSATSPKEQGPEKPYESVTVETEDDAGLANADSGDEWPLSCAVEVVGTRGGTIAAVLDTEKRRGSTIRGQRNSVVAKNVRVVQPEETFVGPPPSRSSGRRESVVKELEKIRERRQSASATRPLRRQRGATMRQGPSPPATHMATEEDDKRAKTDPATLAPVMQMLSRLTDLMQDFDSRLGKVERLAEPIHAIQEAVERLSVHSPHSPPRTEIAPVQAAPPARERPQPTGMRRADSGTKLPGRKDGAGAASALLVHGRMKRSPSDLGLLKTAGPQQKSDEGKSEPTTSPRATSPRGKHSGSGNAFSGTRSS